MTTATDTLRVTLTVDPHGDFPVTLPAEDFDTVCNAIGLRGLARKVGLARLRAYPMGLDGASDTWTFHMEGQGGFRMTVA